jgi:hypothetical protein
MSDRNILSGIYGAALILVCRPTSAHPAFTMSRYASTGEKPMKQKEEVAAKESPMTEREKKGLN